MQICVAENIFLAAPPLIISWPLKFILWTPNSLNLLHLDQL